MGYRLTGDETVPDGVRRIAHELTSEAIGLLDAPGDDIEEVVHEVRKNCKKLRGLVRLVRPGMKDTYTTANATFRDAARHLASIRDAHALLDTFDDVMASEYGWALTQQLVGVRRGLLARAEAASAAVSEGDERIAAARELLQEGHEAIDRWPVPDDPDAMAAGLAKTYGRGRKRLRDTLSHPTDETLHQWRKRVKYTWYHVRLLQDAAPSVLEPLADRMHDLSDVLGDDHDLAVLSAQILAEPDEFGGDLEVAHAVGLMGSVREDLQQRAVRLGVRMYVEPPDAFAGRMVGYWTAWHDHGDEWVAGEVADLAPVDDDLDQRSGRQLYTIARELDVAGRSRMSRDDLVASIRAAGWTAADTS